jgi:hypothetical protein
MLSEKQLEKPQKPVFEYLLLILSPAKLFTWEAQLENQTQNSISHNPCWLT